jgi:exonuclease III
MDSTHLKERHKLTDCICKQEPAFCCIQEIHLNNKNKYYLRVKGWKQVFQANGPKKQARVGILISNKIDFKTKVIKQDEKGHFISVKGKIHQEKVSVLNIHVQGKHIHKRNFIKAQNTHYPTQ